jgi:hypothetical protein
MMAAGRATLAVVETELRAHGEESLRVAVERAHAPAVRVASRERVQGEQRAGVTEVSGFVQSGPRLVLASGTVIIASGPAR